MTNTKITYTQQGDFLLPDLKLSEQPKVEIGIFGKLWVKKMNSIRNRAEEIVNHELIYS